MNSVQSPLFRCAVAVLLVLAACGGDSSGPRLGPPASISAVGPADVTGPVGQALGAPVAVRVRDAQGQDLPGVDVTFNVAAGGGSVSAAQATTGADGTASTSWTLGSDASVENRLDARVVKVDGTSLTVTFRATASPGPASSLRSVGGNDQVGAVTAALRDELVVRVTDSFGNGIAGATVNWSTTSGSITSSSITDVTGHARARWTLGQTAGAATAQASSGTLAAAAFTARATPGPVTAVSINPTTVTIDPGATRALEATARDAFNNLITDRTFTWSSTQPLIARVDAATGVVTGVGGGTATIRATVEGKLGQASVTVTGTPAAIPTITAVSPTLLTPGATITITGQFFTPGVAANAVQIAGVAATVVDATATSIRATLPASGFPCAPTTAQDVTLVTGGSTVTGSATLQAAPTRQLPVGQPVLASSADAMGCVELPQGGGRYLIAVTNTGATQSPFVSLRLRGIAEGASSATVQAATRSHSALVDPTGALPRRARHLQLLEAAHAQVEQLRRSGELRAARTRVDAQQVVPNVGDTIPIRIGRPSADGTVTCSGYDEVQARVVYVGTRGIVTEDVTNPLAGTIDTLYRKLGENFDAVQYDVVTTNFGDPLLLDTQLDNNGRLLMVFSRRVNSNAGVAGFVSPLDFRPRSACAASNAAEVFYGYVPTVNSQQYNNGTIKAWYWDIRATVVHEVKHIASIAMRISNNVTTEETWLEEASAMLVEELWARRIFGYGQGENTGYDRSVGCEIDGALNHKRVCPDRPGVMFIHFAFLSDWMEFPSTESVLCAQPQSACTGTSIYGSGWAFLRWLLDQSGQPEATLLRALHSASERGPQNIQARFGRPYADLFAEWALAVALDDRAGYTPPSNAFRISSWHIRDIYAGLNNELTSFPLVFPLAVTQFSYGNASFDIATIRGGSAAYFELSGTPNGRQALEFTNSAGAPLNVNARVSIVRIQ